jgi:hypothetical protein
MIFNNILSIKVTLLVQKKIYLGIFYIIVSLLTVYLNNKNDAEI